MKITFDISQFLPRYLLNDKNGRALARAIEKAFQYVADKAEEGLDIILDPDKMPEWRLDEVANEYGIPFDFSANIEQKRRWVKNALPMYRILGTKKSVLQYLEGYFEEIEIQESWEYDGDPFHFRVTVDGEWTPENEAWARKAIDRTKPVRCVLDGLRPGCRCVIGFSGEGAVAWRYRYPEAGELVAGEWPEENHLLTIDEGAEIGATGEGDGFVYTYPMAGEYPEINHLYMTDTGSGGMTGDEEIITPIYYPMCGEGYSGEET